MSSRPTASVDPRVAAAVVETCLTYPRAVPGVSGSRTPALHEKTQTQHPNREGVNAV